MSAANPTNNRSEFLSAIDKLIQQIEVAAEKTVKDLSEAAVSSAQSTTAFRNTLKEKTHFVQSGLSSVVMDDRPYAFYLEEGNDQGGPFIYPVKAKALHFFVNGEEVFSKRVRSHGPYHFVLNGRNDAASQLLEIAAKHFSFK